VKLFQGKKLLLCFEYNRVIEQNYFVINLLRRYIVPSHVMFQRARAGNSTICDLRKQIDVSFLCVCPVIVNEFRHHIVKVVCGSTRLSPRDPQLQCALTMWWRNLWSITGQTHKKLWSIREICKRNLNLKSNKRSLKSW